MAGTAASEAVAGTVSDPAENNTSADLRTDDSSGELGTNRCSPLKVLSDPIKLETSLLSWDSQSPECSAQAENKARHSLYTEELDLLDSQLALNYFGNRARYLHPEVPETVPSTN